MDAIQQEMGIDDIANAFQRVDVEEMLDMNSWFLVFHCDFGSENSHRCRPSNLNKGTFLRWREVC